MAATREDEYSALAPVLYLAFELGNDFWKLGFTVGMGQQPRERNIAARDLDGLQREIRLAKKRFGLPGKAPGAGWLGARRGGGRGPRERGLATQKREPRRHPTRIEFWGRTQGSPLPVKADFAQRLESV